MLPPKPLLKIHEISKSYATKVLKRVTLDIHHGEIHGIIGANGAGKSTLCNIIAGVTQSDAGEMHLNGQPYDPKTRRDSLNCGVQMVHQELSLISNLTVAENLFFTNLPTRAGLIDQEELHARATLLLDRLGLSAINPETIVGSLGAGQQQLVEIAIALSKSCTLLILDEPTSSLSTQETNQLFEWLQQIRSEGIGVIFISHRIPELKKITDRLTILSDGECIYSDTTDKIVHQQILDLIAGTAETTQPKEPFVSYATDEPALSVKNLSLLPNKAPISFFINRGERVGLTGLVGSGRTELLSAIYGVSDTSRGTLQINNGAEREVFRGAHQAARAGLGMLPEDRKKSGVMLNLDIKSNLTITSLRDQFSRAGFISEKNEFAAAIKAIRRLKVKCDHVSQKVRTLSGGNQQKIAIGKWLITDSNILLLDEPTRGIDAAARLAIHQLIAEAASTGKSIIMASNDLEELMHNCDRIIVLAGGEISKIFVRASWSYEEIIKSCFSPREIENHSCIGQ